MTSVDVQRSFDIGHDGPNRMGGGRFNGLPDTFWDSFNRQNKLRDDLTLLGTASDRLTISEHKKSGARPDDFDLSYSHAVDVLHWRKLNNNRFIPRSHDLLPLASGWTLFEASQSLVACQSCAAKCAVSDSATFDSISLGHLSLGPTRDEVNLGASFIQPAGHFSIAKTGNPKITTQISKANNAIAAVIHFISQPVRDS